MLVRAAHSANIKERRDCSCACSTPRARWSCRPSTSRSTSARCPPRSPRCWTRTTPPGPRTSSTTRFAGGTHLPDITVITPVLDGGELLGFAASRAHHADVGGPSPGSMPADSTTLDEEGVVIAPRRLDADSSTSSPSRCASPPSAAPTCAPSSPPTRGRQAARGAARAGPAAARSLGRMGGRASEPVAGASGRAAGAVRHFLWPVTV